MTCEEDRMRSWQRRCVGTQWEGELGTCPAATGAVNEPPGPLPIGEYDRLLLRSVAFLFSMLVHSWHLLCQCQSDCVVG